MEQIMGSSMGIQQSMRLGESRDIYYYTSKTLSKQSIPTICDNRFYQELTSLGAGSSTFIISVDQGISDIILSAKLPEQGGAVDYTNLALPRGWVYHLINRLSVRYGSSSQYFWNGSQVLIENLREMPNPTTRDQLYELGGALMTTVAQFASDNLYAYAYLNLPHSSPNGSMSKPNPFPSELIGQPIVITLELNPLPSIFSSSVALGSLAGAPKALQSAYFQVKQIHAKDAGELMSMPGGRGSAYSLPLKAFYQNQVDIQVGIPASTAVPASVGPTKYELLLTGFRNGEVRSIFFWVTRASDVNPATGAPFVKNYDNYILPKDVELLYNGTVYYRAKNGSSQMWSLVSTETPPLLQCTVLSLNSATPAVIVNTSKVANWTEIPFAQVFEQLSGAHMYVAGKLIQNAVVNLSITLPDNDRYIVSLTYAYNSTLMFSEKNCEYVF